MDYSRSLKFTRRDVLRAIPALAAASVTSRLVAQAPPMLQARSLNAFTLRVSDPQKSLEFYQAVLGLPVQARQGSTTILRIGSGPQFMALAPAGGDRPSISQLGMALTDFNVERILKTLAAHGITPVDGDQPPGPLKVRVSRRGAAAGGSQDGTPEVLFGDADGILVQLQDASYCGGSGPLGNMCSPQANAPKGLLAVRDLSHFTIMGVADPAASNAFYQKLFGFNIQANQGASPLLGVGQGVHFLMFTGGAGGRGAAGRGGAGRAGAGGAAGRGAGTTAPNPAPAAAPASAPRTGPRIDHVCLGMDNFNVDGILKTLEGFGIKPRGTNPLGPMMSYVSMRMENRGGAPGGTPELYFTDPDGLSIQLQDVKYCGGGGYLGDVCSG
jgi:catechol 2,3-dioxygenase-like lactoylglutathione lyase family enzyme